MGDASHDGRRAEVGGYIRFGTLQLGNTRGKHPTVWRVTSLPDLETFEYVNAAAFKTASELFDLLSNLDSSTD